MGRKGLLGKGRRSGEALQGSMSGEWEDAQRDNGSPGKQKQPQEWRQAGEGSQAIDFNSPSGERLGGEGLRRGGRMAQVQRATQGGLRAVTHGFRAGDGCPTLGYTLLVIIKKLSTLRSYQKT